MASLAERRGHRDKIMQALYEADSMEGPVEPLRDRLRIPHDDMVAACEYLESEGSISVDWLLGRNPGFIKLTHTGIQLMESADHD